MRKQINKRDFLRKCRLCGRLGRRFTKIFSSSESSAENLSELIFNCLRLKVREDDYLPINICDDCSRKLTSWRAFYRKCQETQEKLEQEHENCLNIYDHDISKNKIVKTLNNNYHSLPYVSKSATDQSIVKEFSDSPFNKDHHKIDEFSKGVCKEDSLSHLLKSERNKQQLKEFIEVCDETDQDEVASFSERIFKDDVIPTAFTSAAEVQNVRNVSDINCKETIFSDRTFKGDSLIIVATSTIAQHKVAENIKGYPLSDLITSQTDEREVATLTQKTLKDNPFSNVLTTSNNQHSVIKFFKKTVKKKVLQKFTDGKSKGKKTKPKNENRKVLADCYDNDTEIKINSKDITKNAMHIKYRKVEVPEFESQPSLSYGGSEVAEYELSPSINLDANVTEYELPSTNLDAKVAEYELPPSTNLDANVTEYELSPSTHLDANMTGYELSPSTNLDANVTEYELPLCVNLTEVPEFELSPSVISSVEVPNFELSPSVNLSIDVLEYELPPSVSSAEEQNHHIKDEAATVQDAKKCDKVLQDQEETLVNQCNLCDKLFASKAKLKLHVARHLISAPEYPCEICHKLYMTKFSLRAHLLTHSDSRNFCCHVCGQLLRTASSLCIHMKQHTNERQYECPLCGKAFRQSSHLLMHQKSSHAGERPYTCSHCNLSLTTRFRLNRHVEGVHNGMKKFKCPVCGKEFLYAHLYKAHMLGHEGLKNNMCEVCGKTFITNNGLVRHRRFHTGERPFKCDICGKTFADCSNRKRHMAQHEDPKPKPKPRNRRKAVLPPKSDKLSDLSGKTSMDFNNRKQDNVQHENPNSKRKPRNRRKTVLIPKPDIMEVQDVDTYIIPYTNLRTFLESPEIVETLTVGQCDDEGEENGILNMEYVTLTAALDDDDIETLDSNIQDVTMLPKENMSEYELLLTDTLSSVPFDEQAIHESSVFQTADSKNTAICSYQPVDLDSNDLTEVFLTPKSEMLEDNIGLMDRKEEAFSKELEPNNLLEVFLESQHNHEPSQEIDISLIEKDETFLCESDETANIISVLMAHDTNNTTTNKSLKVDSNLFSFDNLNDQESIIRMLHSQGTTVA